MLSNCHKTRGAHRLDGDHTVVRYNFYKLQLCYDFHFIAKLLPSVLRTVTKINSDKMCNYYKMYCQRRFYNCTCVIDTVCMILL